MGRTFNGSSWLKTAGANPFTAFPLSISAWYRYAAAGAESYVAALSIAPSNWLLLDVGSGFAYAWAYNSTSNYATASNNEVVAPAWNHVVGVFTATSRTIYLNGVASVGSSTSITPTFAGASASVGAIVDGSGKVFNGFEVGDVSFWDIALSAQEVAALDRGVAPTRIRSGPKLYYPLDGMVGGHLINRVNNSTDYTLALGAGSTDPVASAHPPVQMPFGVRPAGWLGNRSPPAVVLVPNNVAVGSPVFVAPAFTTFPRAADLATSSPVLGQPAAKDKSATTVFAQTLSGPAAVGWQGRTLRQRFEPGMLSAVNPGGIRASLQFAAGTSGQIDALYIGHAASSGDPYDFDGNQVQLKFSGANTMAVSGAGSVQSDAAAFAYDPTRALIVSAAFSGTQVNLAAF